MDMAAVDEIDSSASPEVTLSPGHGVGVGIYLLAEPKIRFCAVSSKYHFVI